VKAQDNISRMALPTLDAHIPTLDVHIPTLDIHKACDAARTSVGA